MFVFSFELAFLVQVAPSLKELRELDLSSNKSVGDTLQKLLQTLPLSQITKLPLNNCALSTPACHALGMKPIQIQKTLNFFVLNDKNMHVCFWDSSQLPQCRSYNSLKV